MCRATRLFRVVSSGFARQQRPFTGEAPAVAAQGAVTADHAVAGDGQGDRVGAAGLGHGPHRLGGAQPAGELGVAHGAAGGDQAQLLPDAPAERRAAQIEWR